MIKKLMVGALVLGGIIGFAPTKANAWTAGTPDPDDRPNTVTNSETGDVTVSGWIGEWDDSDTDSPSNPADPSAINVTIPTKVLYANSVDDTGTPTATIISPVYKIENNSTTNKVSVAVDNFTLKNAVNVTQDLSIKTDSGGEVALQNKNGKMLSSQKYLTTVATSSQETFKFVGSIDQKSFPSKGSDALRPEYQMMLHFTALKK